MIKFSELEPNFTKQLEEISKKYEFINRYNCKEEQLIKNWMASGYIDSLWEPVLKLKIARGLEDTATYMVNTTFTKGFHNTQIPVDVVIFEIICNIIKHTSEEINDIPNLIDSVYKSLVKFHKKFEHELGLFEKSLKEEFIQAFTQSYISSFNKSIESKSEKFKNISDSVLIKEYLNDEKDSKIIHFNYCGEGDPVLNIDSAIKCYCSGKQYNEFVDINMDNPWMRLVVIKLN